MSALPSIAMLFLIGALSLLGMAVIRKPWQRCVVLSFALVEFAGAFALMALVFGGLS